MKLPHRRQFLHLAAGAAALLGLALVSSPSAAGPQEKGTSAGGEFAQVPGGKVKTHNPGVLRVICKRDRGGCTKPGYLLARPNGPDCPPVCKFARARLDVGAGALEPA